MWLVPPQQQHLEGIEEEHRNLCTRSSATTWASFSAAAAMAAANRGPAEAAPVAAGAPGALLTSNTPPAAAAHGGLSQVIVRMAQVRDAVLAQQAKNMAHIDQVLREAREDVQRRKAAAGRRAERWRSTRLGAALSPQQGGQ
jgi:hypothetical protein